MVPSIFRHINIFEKRFALVSQFSKFFPKKIQEKFSGETGCSKFRGARRSGKVLFGSFPQGLRELFDIVVVVLQVEISKIEDP